jgi:hypothetical protein
MMYEPFVFITLVACVVFQILAWRAEDRAYKAERRYKQLRTNIALLEHELTPRFSTDDPEFLAGWNMAMGKAKSMIGEVRRNA